MDRVEVVESETSNIIIERFIRKYRASGWDFDAYLVVELKYRVYNNRPVLNMVNYCIEIPGQSTSCIPDYILRELKKIEEQAKRRSIIYNLKPLLITRTIEHKKVGRGVSIYAPPKLAQRIREEREAEMI